MNRKTHFVCFTGIDGSGKSTLARLLILTLRQNGIESKYLYSRYRPLLSTPFLFLARHVFLRGESPTKDYDRYVTARESASSSRIASLAYEYILLFDYIFQVLAKVQLSLMRGQNIVCDRYVYDTIINDMLDSSYSADKVERLLERLFLILPKPDVAFLVDVPEEIAFNRKNDVPSIKFLTRRRPLFLSIAKSQNLIILDGSKDLKELQRVVKEIVLS